MEWNNIEIAQKFLRQANALHPEEARSEGKYEEELARQELFYECYMTSFSKDKLIALLQSAVEGEIKIPEGAEVDEQRYRMEYSRQAALELKKIQH